MNATHRRENFRAIISGPDCIFPASVFDPLSARAAADLGFELTMLAGSIASMTVLGDPDLCVITLSEFADQIRRISRAAPTPLLVDADHGYGNALNVRRTVEEVENAGAAALTIEDTLLPKGFNQKGNKLINVEEGVGKMRAALQARQDPALSIIARTSAIGLTGLEDAIARLKAYEAVGVDAVFITGLADKTQLDAVTQAIDLPIVLGAAPAEIKDRAYLKQKRVKICLQGHQPFLCSVEATYAALQALRNGTAPRDISGVASPERISQLTRKADFNLWSDMFLGGK
jgi:carboxyvinyl-carboxyphosphonate phosphorylmutase